MGSNNSSSVKGSSGLPLQTVPASGCIESMLLDKSTGLLVTGGESQPAIWGARQEWEKLEAMGRFGGGRGHTRAVTHMVLVHDSVIYTGSLDGTVREWNVETQKLVKVVADHCKPITGLLFEDNVLYSSSAANKILCWDFRSDSLKFTLECHKKGVNALLHFRPVVGVAGDSQNPVFVAASSNEDQTLLISGSEDRTARSWNLRTGECEKIFKHHLGGITVMAGDPEHNLLFTAASDGDVIIWDVNTAVIKMSVKAHLNTVTCLNLDADRHVLFTASEDGTAKSWNLNDWNEQITPGRSFEGQLTAVRSMLVIEKSGMVITGSTDNKARAYDPSSGNLLTIFEHGSQGNKLKAPQINRTSDEGTVTSMVAAWGRLYIGSTDGKVTVWDVKNLIPSEEENYLEYE